MPASMSTADSNLAHGSAATWRDYYELGKPKVVALIVFTAIVGMFLAAPGMPPWQGLFSAPWASGSRLRAPPRSTMCSTVVSTRKWRARGTGRSRRVT